MNYGKFKFDTAQRAKESRRKASTSSIKEMKYRPKIGVGDFDTKTRQVAKFLGEGHKVKITIMFRGRELSHQELGLKILNRVAEQVNEIAKVEASPKVDGRNMIMVLAPDRRAQQAAQKARSDQARDGAAAEAASQAAADAEDQTQHRSQDQPQDLSQDQPEQPAGNGAASNGAAGAGNGAAAPSVETTTQES